MQLLETDRLILRSWTEDDLDDFYEYASNPLVGPNAGWPPHTEKAVSLHILRKFILNDDVWAIVEKTSGRVIGSLGLHRDIKRCNDHVRMVGYVLRQESWGLGYTTEAVQRVLRYAFEEVDIALVSVYHYPSNHRSQRVIEKCGFTFEGVMREASTLYDGKVLDDVCYSMTREEYLSRKT